MASQIPCRVVTSSALITSSFSGTLPRQDTPVGLVL